MGTQPIALSVKGHSEMSCIHQVLITVGRFSLKGTHYGRVFLQFCIRYLRPGQRRAQQSGATAKCLKSVFLHPFSEPFSDLSLRHYSFGNGSGMVPDKHRDVRISDHFWTPM